MTYEEQLRDAIQEEVIQQFRVVLNEDGRAKLKAIMDKVDVFAEELRADE